MHSEEKCPQCGGHYGKEGKKVWVALAHQIEGHEDVPLCSLKCLVEYLGEYGN